MDFGALRASLDVFRQRLSSEYGVEPQILGCS